MAQLNNPDLLKAALIIIGNEILTGRTHDTNTHWIAGRLTEKGIMIAEVRIVPDERSAIIEAVKAYKDKVDYVFTTGGIGPTHDDITAECIAEAVGQPLEENPQAYDVLLQHYGAENLNDARRKMAMMPKGAGLIPNPVSGAPGFIFDNIIVMAGVPRIMQAMLDHVLSQIKSGTPMISASINCTLQESIIAPGLSKLQEEFDDVEIGSYPHYRGGVLGLSVVLRSTKAERLEEATDALVKLIRALGDEPRAQTIPEGTEFILQDTLLEGSDIS